MSDTTTTTTPSAPSVETLIAYEQGELDGQQTIDFFAGLIRSGMAYRLQGSYGRAADFFVRNGIISDTGEILVQTCGDCNGSGNQPLGTDGDTYTCGPCSGAGHYKISA